MNDSEYHLKNKNIIIIGCDDELSDYLSKSLLCAGSSIEVFSTINDMKNTIRTANPDFFIVGTKIAEETTIEFIDSLRKKRKQRTL